jgi:hypothetical protein
LERIKKLENFFMQATIKVEGALKAFSDPAFQIILRDAAEKAAATEREEDYALLAQLLICHIQKGNERIKRAGIHRAIQIVDEIDNGALCVLTVIHAITSLKPVAGKCDDGLKSLDNLFSKLMYMEFPPDDQWPDHLDILGAIRKNSVIKPFPLEEYFANELNGYVCVGIKKDSPQFETAKTILSSNAAYSGLLVENEFLEGYFRLKLPVLDLKGLPFQTSMPNDIQDTLNKIIALYSNDSRLLLSVRDKFKKVIDEYEHLAKLKQWYNALQYSFEITAIGKALAHTNAKRCDPNLPDLNL